MTNKWFLWVIGGVLLLGGSILGTYLARRPAQPDYEAKANKPTNAVVEGLQEKQRKIQEVQAKVKQYNTRKDEIRQYVRSKIDSEEQIEAEASNYVLTLLGIDNCENYKTLDLNDPAIQILGRDAAIKVYNAKNLTDLRTLSVEIGESAPPDEASLKAGIDKWRKQYSKGYGNIKSEIFALNADKIAIIHIYGVFPRYKEVIPPGWKPDLLPPGVVPSGPQPYTVVDYYEVWADYLCVSCIDNLPYQCDSHKPRTSDILGLGWTVGSVGSRSNLPLEAYGYALFTSRNNLPYQYELTRFDQKPQIKKLWRAVKLFEKFK